MQFINVIDVHCDEGTRVGKVENDEKINLTNEQAIYINDEGIFVIQ